MGRPVSIRMSYDNDARYMLRLKEAVEKDGRDLEFQEEVSGMLAALARKLIVGPNDRPAPVVAVNSKKRRNRF